MGFFSKIAGREDPRDSVITQQADQIRRLTSDNSDLRQELMKMHKLGRDAIEADMLHEREMRSIETEAIRLERAAEVADRTGLVVEEGGVRYHIPGGDGPRNGGMDPEPPGEDLPS